MQKINIPILGLAMGGEARSIKDGECSIMHNLTADGGGARVIAPPTKGITASSFGGYKEYFHEKTGQWLFIKNGRLYNDKGTAINNDGSAINRLAFMGNIVIMYCTDGVRYAIFDGYYRYLGKLPQLPKMKISIKPIHVTTLSDESYYTDSAGISSSEEGLRWKNVSKGYFDECLSGLYTQGAFVDRTLFRWAARLFDGSYICYSPIYYVEDSDALIENIGYWALGASHSIGRDNMNFFSTPLSIDGSSSSRYFTSVRGFVPSFHPEAYNLKSWRDIIVALELFATPSIMGHESRNDKLNVNSAYLDTGVVQGHAWVEKLTNINSYDRYEWKGAKKIREEVADASLFYKIAEFDLEGKEVWRLDNTSPTQLAVQTRLPINEQPHEQGSAAFKYIYNGKLHLAGVNEQFSDVYDNYAIAARTSTSDGIIQITSVVTVGTEQGERHVVTTSENPAIHKEGDVYKLAPLLHYADARATNLKICIAYKNSIYRSVTYRDFPLTAHKTLNYSYYLSDANAGSEHVVEVTNNSSGLHVEVDGSNKENAFVAAVKKEFPDRTDYTGTYIFTFNSSNSTWNLNVKFADNTTTEKNGVIVFFTYGLKLYSEDKVDWAVVANGVVKDGDTITVKLDYGTGTLAGLRPIVVGGEGWSELTSDDAQFFHDEDGNLTSFTLKNIKDNRIYTRKNVMRVSRVDNPFFFPAESTYSFDSDIVALCSNTVAVSQGQFGQHPLYVFTNEGIWLMSVDTSGVGNYLAQVPCSREICNNAAGVSVTTRGVIFPTSKGLMLINGGETYNISEAVSGLHAPEVSRSNDVVERICGIVSREGIRSRVSFLDYLSTAFTAFDYNSDLLYVCNSAYDYVYVYNNASGVWSTADGRYSVKVEYSDRLILGSYVDGNFVNEYYTRYTFENQNSRIDSVPVVIVTGGCNFATMDYKRISETALRATFHASKMGFYTLGSVDGVFWELVGGRDFFKETAALCRDVVKSFARSRAYRFFAFAFVGELRSDSRFAFFEAALQTDFERRIR